MSGEKGHARWLVAGFALAFSHLLLQVFSSPFYGEYVIHSRTPVLASTDPGSDQLYLRHSFELTKLPDEAWLQVLGRDWLELYVNGQKLADTQKSGYAVAIQTDIAHRLRVGKNVLAIVARRTRSEFPPGVAVEGGFRLRGIEHPLSSNENWRHALFFEQTHTYWFTPEFDDSHWQQARRVSGRIRSIVPVPPRALSVSADAVWISADTDRNGRTTVRKEFHNNGRPKQAWLRVSALAPYGLAINGHVVERASPVPRGEITQWRTDRTYDLVPLLRNGSNTISLTLTARTGPALLKADGEIFHDKGSRIELDTGATWRCTAGVPLDWYRTSTDARADWRPCGAQSETFGESAERIRREFEPTDVSIDAVLRYSFLWLTLALSVGFLTNLLVGKVHQWVMRRCPAVRISRTAVSLALLPLILGSGLLELIVWDSRIARADVFSLPVFVGLTLSVPLQWLFAARFATLRNAESRTPRRFALSTRMSLALLMLSITAGAWLRLVEIAEYPLHPDEVSVYRATLGTLERGLPSIKVHENIPIGYPATSELTFYPNALVALLTDRDYLIVRLAGVLFSILTIPLLYAVGTGLFGRNVGLVAACTYALSPLSIEMSNFGRYFSQLQFLTLATVYALYFTLKDLNSIDRRWLWLTALLFSAMYLSWEGSAFFAPAMVLAVIIAWRWRILALLRELHVWFAVVSVGLVLLLQHAYRTLVQSGQLQIGSGTSDAAITLMSELPGFDPLSYLFASCWTEDALLPVLGLLGAGFLALRHGFQRQLRYLLTIYVVSALLMAFLLPVSAPRYGYQFTPLLLLLDSLVLIVLARSLYGSIVGSSWRGAPAWWGGYAKGLSIGFVGLIVTVASGATVRTDELTWLRGGQGASITSDHPSAATFLRQHMRDGDLLLATIPHAVEHYLERPVDYWPQSRLHLQAVLDDEKPILRHRLIGTEMISDEESLRRIFSENRRIWLVLAPSMHARTNLEVVSELLRASMDVVFENTACIVLFRGKDVNAPNLIERNESALRRAKASYLP